MGNAKAREITCPREASHIDRYFTPPFTISRPARLTNPLVFDSPHSGKIYPPHFKQASNLAPLALRKSEDAYVDELFGHVPLAGSPLIAAHFPRAYLDVNREPYELDPKLIRGPLPDYANTESLRVAGGLGTVARLVAEREEIYADRLTLETALTRIAKLYHPYHAALTALLREAMTQTGQAILIDCHSMPSYPAPGFPDPRPDIVLGDRFGSACDPALTDFTALFFTRLGYNVVLNKPYAGGFMIEHYGKRELGIHALQIEINRALYMNEKTFVKNRGFAKLCHDLEALTKALVDELPALGPSHIPDGSQWLAAE